MIDVKLVHDIKGPAPIDVTDAGMMTDVSFCDPLKESIEVTLLGIT